MIKLPKFSKWIMLDEAKMVGFVNGGKVYENLTVKHTLKLLDNEQTLRGLYSAKTNTNLIWNAYNANHDQIFYQFQHILLDEESLKSDNMAEIRRYMNNNSQYAAADTLVTYSLVLYHDYDTIAYVRRPRSIVETEFSRWKRSFLDKLNVTEIKWKATWM